MVAKVVVDISTARLFWMAFDLQTKLVVILREDFGDTKADAVPAHALIHVFLALFSATYALWRKKVPLIDMEVTQCKDYAFKMGRCWSRLGS